jgi:hypothetical protein
MMLTKSNFKITVHTCLIGLANLAFLLTPRPILANPNNLKSLQILHPTITLDRIYMGKFLFCQKLGKELLKATLIVVIGQ